MLRVPLFSLQREVANNAGARLYSGAVATKAAVPLVQQLPSEEHKIRYYPKLGNRDILSWGMSGAADYHDHVFFPCPAVRFRPKTEEFFKYEKLQQGHWGDMTIEEKKAAYRQSYCQTFSEFKTGQKGVWKSDLAYTLFWVSLCGIGLIWSDWVFHEPHDSLSVEGTNKLLDRYIRERQQWANEYISDKYDYTKGEWKK